MRCIVRMDMRSRAGSRAGRSSTRRRRPASSRVRFANPRRRQGHHGASRRARRARRRARRLRSAGSARRGQAARTSPCLSAADSEKRAMIVELRRRILEHSVDLGANFAEEALKIHQGLVPDRPIHGQASVEEARAPDGGRRQHHADPPPARRIQLRRLPPNTARYSVK